MHPKLRQAAVVTLGFGSVMYILTGLYAVINDFVGSFLSSALTVSPYGYLTQFYCGFGDCSDVTGVVPHTYLLFAAIGCIGLVATFLIERRQSKIGLVVWGFILAVLTYTMCIDVTNPQNHLTFFTVAAIFWWIVYTVSYLTLLIS